MNPRPNCAQPRLQNREKEYTAGLSTTIWLVRQQMKQTMTEKLGKPVSYTQ